MSPTAARPAVSIIIVTWNVASLLRACLASIAATAGDIAHEVIVVDSASADDTVSMVRREFPHVTLIPCADNVGFARGNNLGLVAARGDLLLLLNPDTELRPGALRAMVAYAKAQPTAGLIGPQLFNGDGTHQSSRRRFPSPMLLFFESTWAQAWAPRRMLDAYYVRDTADDAVAEVDWITGACMLTRRRVVDTVGGLDEGYFMYSEELDWARRMKDAGWRVVYLPSAHVMHHVGRSSEQAVTRRHVNFNRAKLRYARKFHGRRLYMLLRLWLLLNFALQLLVEGAKWVVGHRRPLRRQRVRAYRTVLASGLTAAGYE